MKNNWNVTYETVTPESAAEGDYADSGFELEHASFRDAIQEFSTGGYCEADSCPISLRCPPRWFVRDLGVTDYGTGEQKQISLHIPEHITASSRMRLARLVGCSGVDKR